MKFKLDLFHRLSEQHLWLSLFDCCPWKLFGHSFRMTCCSLSTFSILAICTIFYGLVEEQTEYEDLMGKSAFRLYDSVLVFISSTCSLLTSSLMLEIFRHCKQKVRLEIFGSIMFYLILFKYRILEHIMHICG